MPDSRRFAFLCVAAFVVAFIGAAVPYFFVELGRGPSPLVFGYSCAAVWLALEVVALVLYGRRGFWLLAFGPIVFWWPILFALMDYTCRHNVNACL
jgi:hypothetical protein